MFSIIKFYRKEVIKIKTINEAMINLRENEINDKNILNTLKKIKEEIYNYDLSDNINRELLPKLGILKDAIDDIVLEYSNLIEIPNYKVK